MNPKSAAKTLNRDGKVIFLNRVSSRNQRNELPVYRRYVRKWCKRRGIRIVRTFTQIGNGSKLDWLSEPARLARRYGYTLLAWSIDRVVRPIDEAYGHPGRDELDRLAAKLAGVTLATIVPPDLSAKRVNARRTKLFHKARGKRGGKRRPPSVRRQELRQLVKAIYDLQGIKNFAVIGRIVDESRATCRNWYFNEYHEDR